MATVWKRYASKDDAVGGRQRRHSQDNLWVTVKSKPMYLGIAPSTVCYPLPIGHSSLAARSICYRLCSKRKSYAFVRYLESREKDELSMLQSPLDYAVSHESFIVDCKNRVLDKLCFSKHNAKQNIGQRWRPKPNRTWKNINFSIFFRIQYVT
ncbi:hypothetical protein CDAR_455661 [Caerostris darwini]|uniref:Uncharacterized protein n=1 Tax=Caerostris darwini TaxID=1538125 RepID=A0AAV4SWC0_9ARAC|nr:hypothetical protein CDAR_455661 [Caerostris darwini]